MPEETPHAPAAEAGLRELSQGLSLAALAMLAVFLLAMLSSVLPARLGDPSWQLAMVTALVDNGVVALVALALLHIAARLNTNDLLSAAWRDRASRLAVLAAAGFLLLVPLQGWNSWRLSQNDQRLESRARLQEQRRFTDLRRAVDQATSTVELQSRLRQVVGPGLPPLNPAVPLAQQKQQLSSILSRNQRLLAQRRQIQFRQRDQARSGGGLIPTPLRDALASLAYALGFAALARRQGSPLSWLANRRRPARGRLGKPMLQPRDLGFDADDGEVRQEDLIP